VTKKRNRHAELVGEVLRLLKLYGCEEFPVKNLATKRKEKRTGREFYSRGLLKPGVADVIACGPAGRFVAVEVKVTDKRGRMDTLRPAQVAFLDAVTARCGVALVARDTVDAVIQAREQIEKGLASEHDDTK
jgi:hypothetical protein